MQDDDLKTVKIAIAGRSFPVKVTDEEERTVRDIEIELNNKISDFQKLYPGRDKLDCVIMTLLTYTYDQKKPSDVIIPAEISEKIAEIRASLDDIVSR